jgi:hypothetical protein
MAERRPFPSLPRAITSTEPSSAGDRLLRDVGSVAHARRRDPRRDEYRLPQPMRAAIRVQEALGFAIAR